MIRMLYHQVGHQDFKCDYVGHAHKKVENH